MKVMDWVRKLTDIIMPLEPVDEEEEAKEIKKAETKTEVKPEQIQPEAQAQPVVQNYQAEKRAATGVGGSTMFTRNGGMVTTSESGVTSMGGVRYEAYSSDTSVRPSLAVVKTPQLTMKIYAPNKYDEQVKAIVDDLLKKNAVIVNFEGVDDNEQQRIGDFIIGAVYSIDGKAEMITNKIILYVPNGIDYENAAATTAGMRRYN